MTPAIDLLKKYEVGFEVHSYQHDPRSASYGMEAADKLGLPPARVFKTLLVQADSKELLVAVIPVAHNLNLKRLAAAAGVKKLAMAQPQLAQRTTGYLTGGISPLGQKKVLRTFVDASVLDFASVFVSAGRRGLELELSPDSLVQHAEAVVASLV